MSIKALPTKTIANDDDLPILLPFSHVFKLIHLLYLYFYIPHRYSVIYYLSRLGKIKVQTCTYIHSYGNREHG